MLAKVRELVLPQIERQAPFEAWIIDDTGFPKKGKHSVGVAHQYCGQTGKQDNCQVAVSLSLANHEASLPVAYQLYLPKSGRTMRERRAKAGVPDEIEFQTKPEIALEQIAWACAAGLPRGVVLMDAAYGTDASLRARRDARLGLDLCRPASAPERWSQAWRRRCGQDHPAEALALGLPKRAGRRSPGARAQPRRSTRASPGCGCGPAATAARGPNPRNGC